LARAPPAPAVAGVTSNAMQNPSTTFFVVTGQTSDELLKRLRHCMSRLDPRAQPSGGAQPTHCVSKQAEVSSITGYLVLGTNPSDKVMDEAYYQWRVHLGGKRVVPFGIVLMADFVRSLETWAPPSEWRRTDPPKAFADRYLYGLRGFYALPSWTFDLRNDACVVFAPATVRERLASGGHLDALFFLRDLPRTGTAPPFLPCLRRMCQFTLTWSASYAEWSRDPIARALTYRDEHAHRRVVEACNSECGLLGELLQRLRRCEVVHEPNEHVSVMAQHGWPVTNCRISVLARVVSHVLAQHRAALASVHAMLALRNGDEAGALKVCRAHDLREQTLWARYEPLIFRDPTYEGGTTLEHLGGFGLPLLGTWVHGYGLPSSADHVRQRGLILVDDRPSYDMQLRTMRQCNLERIVADRAGDPMESLQQVVDWHVHLSRYARVFPSREIGALATFLTEELPRRCEQSLLHLGAAVARAPAGRTDVQVATWAAFGCPRSVQAFTRPGSAGRRAKDEFPSAEHGFCLPVEGLISDVLPVHYHDVQARSASIPDILAMVTDHLATLACPAHATSAAASDWCRLVSAIRPSVTTRDIGGGKLRVDLTKEAVPAADGEETTRRSWNALVACLSAESRVSNFKCNKQRHSLHFTMLGEHWEAAQRSIALCASDCDTALGLVVHLRELRERVGDAWRPSAREDEKQAEAFAWYKAQWLKEREAERIARGQALGKRR
jgi:hypothetical protein